MPDALKRGCRWPLCDQIQGGPYCPAHEALRRKTTSPAARGYGREWRNFRRTFANSLIAADVPVACGSSLPDGPVMRDSQCRRAGVWTFRDLHLHHDPPLRPDERRDPRLVCDPRRVGFLCESCHNALGRR